MTFSREDESITVRFALQPPAAEVLLESAFFTGDGILRTSKRLGLRTESSARFERGVDPQHRWWHDPEPERLAEPISGDLAAVSGTQKRKDWRVDSTARNWEDQVAG